MSLPSNNSSIFLQQELRRAEGEVAQARARMVQARSLRELRDALQISLSAIVRPVRHVIPGYTALTAEGDRRAQALVEERLKRLQAQLKAAAGAAALREVAAAVEGLMREWREVSPDFQQAIRMGYAGLDRVRAELKRCEQKREQGDA